MQLSNGEDRLTIDEAALILGMAASSLRLLIRAGKIRYRRIGPNGGRYELRREWLDEYLESCEVAPTQQSTKPQPKAFNKRAKASVTINTSSATSTSASLKDGLKAFKQQMKRGTV